MVADIVRQIVSHQDDIEIVGSLPDVDGVESVAERTDVDLVITTYRRRQSDLRRFDRLLASRPRMRVLAIEDDSRTACMYALLPQTTQLGPLSPRTLLDFIRASEPAWGA